MKNIFEKKIFIVDDDPFCRNIYQQYLISLGYQDLKLFEKGNDCLEQLNQQPEVILLDHDMCRLFQNWPLLFLQTGHI